jgi:hypothetical protein
MAVFPEKLFYIKDIKSLFSKSDQLDVLGLS